MSPMKDWNGVTVGRRNRYLATTLLSVISATLSAAALAQQPAPAEQKKSATEQEKKKAQGLEEVVVTGSLIRDIAPVGANVIGITQEAIETSGTTDTNQLVGTLPQSSFFLGFQNPGLNVLAGVSRVPINTPNLRNLPQGATGAPTTLVMLDGHRIVPSGIEQSAVDAGIVPSGILQRVETILDGTSAVYGSDAAGGVINFITRKRFDETKADVQYGFADNYYTRAANVTSGTTWEGGGVGFTYSFGMNSPLFAKDRDYALNRNYLLPGNPFTGTACEDHSTVTAAGRTFVTSGSTLTPGGETNKCANNAFSSMVSAQERHAGFMTLSQDLGESMRLDVSALYSTRKAEGFFGPFTGTKTVTSTTPYFRTLTTQSPPVPDTTSQSVSFSYGPLLGTQNQKTTTEVDLWQVTPTLTFDVGEWQLRTLVSYGESTVVSKVATLDTALQAVMFAGTTTATTLNPYNPAASTNLAQINSLFYESYRKGEHKFRQIQAIADGPLFAISGGEIKGAFGAEYTKTDFTQTNTNAVTHALLTPVSATTSPKSLFGELNVPLVSSANAMTGIKALTLSGSLRWDDYQEFGKTTNPKISLSYDPFTWITLRGNWGKSFRAPTAVDKVATNANAIRCFSTTGAEANCTVLPSAFTFIPPGYPSPLPTGTIYLYLTGAKPDLGPETSKNWSAGFDFRPTWLEGLTISPSYYQIDYENQISLPTQGPTGGLNLIYSGATALFLINPLTNPITFLSPAQINAFATLAPNGGPQLISNVVTPSGYNVLYALDGRTTNLGGSKVAGLDLAVKYAHTTSFGSIDGAFNGTWRLKGETAFFRGSPFTDTLADGVSKFSMTAQVGATIGNFRTQATFLQQRGFKATPASTRLASQTEIDSFQVVNLSFRYNIDGNTPLLRDLGLTLNIDNVLDEEPPINLTTTGGSANGQTVGRFFQFGIAKKF